MEALHDDHVDAEDHHVHADDFAPLDDFEADLVELIQRHLDRNFSITVNDHDRRGHHLSGYYYRGLHVDPDGPDDPLGQSLYVQRGPSGITRVDFRRPPGDGPGPSPAA